MPTRHASSSHTLIIGCGYVGTAIALRLQARRERVTAWVRSEESAAPLRGAGFAVLTGDVGHASSWVNVPGDVTHVIHCASSGRSGAAVYASVYREGLRHLVRRFPMARKFFTSSTSVYAQTHGDVVTEQSPAEPVTETGLILRETEQLGLDHGVTVLRLAGIYGPGRSVLLTKLLAGEAVIEGDGMRWLNQIHREDAASAAVHLLTHGEPGELYNVCDNEPVGYYEFYRWLCRQLDKPLPPFGPVNTARKRGFTNKRVSNAKLRATGWEPEFPTYREGYAKATLHRESGS